MARGQRNRCAQVSFWRVSAISILRRVWAFRVEDPPTPLPSQSQRSFRQVSHFDFEILFFDVLTVKFLKFEDELDVLTVKSLKFEDEFFIFV